MSPMRNSAKAIIVRDGRLLTMKGVDPDGHYYLLPGGGQRFGETLQETLKRECREEINTDIKVGKLKFIREYIGAHHEFASLEGDVHKLEFMFLCELAGHEDVGVGETPDADQIGIEWLEIERLMSYRLYPMVIREIIMNLGKGEQCQFRCRYIARTLCIDYDASTLNEHSYMSRNGKIIPWIPWTREEVESGVEHLKSLLKANWGSQEAKEKTKRDIVEQYVKLNLYLDALK